jgi:hypothetical protein
VFKTLQIELFVKPRPAETEEEKEGEKEGD